MKTKLLLALGLALSFNSYSQNNSLTEKPKRHCGSSRPSVDYEVAFQKMLTAHELKQSITSKTSSTVYTIPIIFHIIHNGQAVGTSTTVPTRNLNAAFINGQIATLNADYRKLNTDFSTYVTQASFVNISADVEINFCPAKISPTGAVLAEPGIDRVAASSIGATGTAWTEAYIESTIKPATSWDPTKYYNVFVLEFGGADVGTLGYAQFPTVTNSSTPTIGDLVGSGGNANTDGVALDWHYTGPNNDATYNKGRTLSHETGHWLGLYHIWGDEPACTGTDEVTDTPNQAGENYTCPSIDGDVVTDACTAASPGVNYQNFMDYSDDRCMVMFTAGQKARMQAVLASCPRRLSLTTSNVCTAPTSIEESSIETVVNLFPNPTTGELNLQLTNIKAEDYIIDITNTLGQRIKTIQQINYNGGTIAIDLSNNPTGVYFVSIKSPSNSITKRIILE